MSIKVCKFGGTSLADAIQIRKVRDIVRADDARRFVVPSAPGKRTSHDQKITDLLYLCHGHARQEIPFDDVFGRIAERYRQIIADLGLKLDLGEQFEQVKQGIIEAAAAVPNGESEPTAGGDYAASRGEFLNGQVIAEFLGYEFVDAAEVIFFDAGGKLDMPRSREALQDRLGKAGRAVVPGFYGSTPQGKVKTFSRGGSDITGAVVAAGIDAAVYENWTDVSGLLMADPRIVDNPRTIRTITYQELRELAYMGATVLHDEAIFPVRKAGIPVNIRNTNEPEHTGTTIVAEAPKQDGSVVTGIAGRKDFTVINISKALMNAQIGFGRKVLSVLEGLEVSYEHMPSGIDTMSLVIADKQLTGGRLERAVEGIRRDVEPDDVEVSPNMALLATVGRAMTHTPGVAAKLFGALADAGVNIRMIDQGSSELNIIVGVEADHFETAMRAVYKAFVE